MHFHDKDEILLEICTAEMEALLALNSEIAARPIDAVERVRAMLQAYIDFALENPNAYRLVFCTAPASASVEKQKATLKLGVQCAERFLGVVREIAADGRLRGEPAVVHQILWSACHGLVALMITKTRFPWAEPAVVSRGMIEGLLFGLIAD